MKLRCHWKVGLFVLFLAACTRDAAPEVEPADVTPGATPSAAFTKEPVAAFPLPTIEPIEQIDLDRVPAVDTGHRNVPLDEIIFDTFQPVNRAIPLTDAEPGLIRRLRDAIPPLYEPRFTRADEADSWLSDADIVLGYADGAEAFAYPVRILNFHEIVSHQANGRDILASYCPLCRSGIVYDRRLPGAEAPLLLGNTSALYESDMVMFDHQTGSYWNQVTGEAIVGPLTGRRMPLLPSQMTTWGMWKMLYPGTLALSEETGFDRNYGRDPFTGYAENLNEGDSFFFPVSEAGRDPRLDPGEIVLGVEAGDTRRAYPLSLLGDAVVHDIVGETPVVVFSAADGPSGAVFSPQVDGRELTFVLEGGEIRDRETGSTWNLAGQAVTGGLAGTDLEPVPARSTLWFSLVANFPEIDIYRPASE